MTDYYRDRVRHGGILANNFVKFWWENQVGPMQYGTEEKKPRRFGPGVMGPPVGELQRCHARKISRNDRPRFATF